MRRPRRDVAILFQRPALLPWRSALDNVLLPIVVHGRPKPEHRATACELLVEVGLDAPFHTRLPHELSGGMRQRVALCRSLIQRPRVMLIAEQLAAYAELGVTRIYVRLRDLTDLPHLDLLMTEVAPRLPSS